MPQRYIVVGITAVAALWMYIDRVCFSTLSKSIQTDLAIPEADKAYALGAFFLTYALFQIPTGLLADRFGPRLVLTVSIAAWSLVTGLTGFVTGVTGLLAIRLILGVTESGAYPAAVGLVKRWAREDERGRFSSMVALGGRIGGAVAGWLTARLSLLLAWGAIGGDVGPSGANWRGTFMVYGACGLAVAGLFWVLVRDHPPGAALQTNPSRTSMAQQLRDIGRGLARLVRSRLMWFFGLAQLGVNIGWAFLVTLLPDYLHERFQVPLEERGFMQSVILTAGCVGMVVGGLTADWFRKRVGPRWGRAAPLGVTLAGCAGMCFSVPYLADPWAVVGVLAVMAFLVDLGIPFIWAFAQDVGGRNVGAALGFGNMLGNLAAWRSPILLTQVKLASGWDAAFVVCGVSFIGATVCGLLLDASKPVEPEGPPG